MITAIYQIPKPDDIRRSIFISTFQRYSFPWGKSHPPDIRIVVCGEEWLKQLYSDIPVTRYPLRWYRHNTFLDENYVVPYFKAVIHPDTREYIYLDEQFFVCKWRRYYVELYGFIRRESDLQNQEAVIYIRDIDLLQFLGAETPNEPFPYTDIGVLADWVQDREGESDLVHQLRVLIESKVELPKIKENVNIASLYVKLEKR